MTGYYFWMSTLDTTGSVTMGENVFAKEHFSYSCCRYRKQSLAYTMGAILLKIRAPEMIKWSPKFS